MSLISVFQSEIISRRTYLRLSILDPGRLTNSIPVPVLLTTKHETLTEVANLIFSGEIIAELPATINFFWSDPSKLPGYQTSQVLGMKVAQGYLYFALGADNLSKTNDQLVMMSRLRNIYRMTEGQIISQLAMLMRANVCTIDLSEITVTSLNKPTNEPSISIASHELSVNHPAVSSLAQGMMTSEMLARLNALNIPAPGLSQEDRNKLDSLGDFAFRNAITAADIPTISYLKISGLGIFSLKNLIDITDIPELPPSKISGLGSFATKNSLVLADIPELPTSKIGGLGTALDSKQNLLTSSSTVTVNQIVTTSQQASIGATTTVTTTSVLSPASEVRIITSSTASLEMTASTPITAGVNGQKLTVINGGNFSIYIQAMQVGLRSRSSASFIFNDGWIKTAEPTQSAFLGHNQEFRFINGARVRLNDDYTFFIRNPAGVNQSQEMGSLGMKVSYERGLIVQDLTGFSRAVGYYKYNLNLEGNNVQLPGIISNLAEYKCF